MNQWHGPMCLITEAGKCPEYDARISVDRYNCDLGVVFSTNQSNIAMQRNDPYDPDVQSYAWGVRGLIFPGISAIAAQALHCSFLPGSSPDVRWKLVPALLIG